MQEDSSGQTARGPAALSSGPVQIAYGVTDLTTAAHDWADRLGAGPFFVRTHIPVSEVMIDGRSASFDHSSAYGQWGSVMVELVAVHEPSALAIPGLHHVAFFVESFDAASTELSDYGWARRLSATAGATRFAFHDARSDLGHLVEIYQRSPVLEDFYAMVAAAAEDWDGSDPVRSLG